MTETPFSKFRLALNERPSPADVASVLAFSTSAAVVGVVNAALFTLTTWHTMGGVALALWLTVTVSVSVYTVLKARRARRIVVEHVSRRAVRTLCLTTSLMALPWAVLAGAILPTGGEFEQLLGLLICAGMFTGAAVMLQRTLAAALHFVVIVNVGVLAGCALTGDARMAIVAVYDVICAGFVIYNAFQSGEAARERERSTERLRAANRALQDAYGRISSFAYLDSVTDLPNTKAFSVGLEEQLAVSRDDGERCAVLVCDLDNFKNVNDSHGHPTGDALLSLTAGRIKKVVAGEGMVARLGGDEFAAIVPIGGIHRDPALLARALIDAVAQPALVCGHQVYPATSIGIALMPEHGDTSEALLKKAHAALAGAKERGKGGWVVFDAALGRKLEDTDLIAAELRSALAHGEIDVHYQPKIDLATGRMRGVEALVRWTHAALGQVPPERFLAVAAERGLVHRVTAQVFRQVAEDILAWRAAGIEVGPVAVNVHPVDLKQPDHLMNMIRALMARGLDPDAVSLEITEGCFVGRGTEGAPMILDAIADMGFELALDDFGTGHAALTHLRSLPVSELKIDRRFVSGIVDDPGDRAIVEATVAIARGMGLTSVAEGVETLEQIAVLKEIGADCGQGYFWAKPLPAEALAAFATERSGTPERVSTDRAEEEPARTSMARSRDRGLG